MFRIETGSKFHAAGPATVKELLATRVLVRRTTKSPRADDHCMTAITWTHEGKGLADRRSHKNNDEKKRELIGWTSWIQQEQ